MQTTKNINSVLSNSGLKHASNSALATGTHSTTVMAVFAWYKCPHFAVCFCLLQGTQFNITNHGSYTAYTQKGSG